MFWSWTAWVQTPALPLTSWVTWGKSLSLSAFPSIKWDDNRVTMTVFHKAMRLKEMLHAAAGPCVAHSRTSMNTGHCFIINVNLCKNQIGCESMGGGSIAGLK